jgi:hypothetical protein
LNGAGFGEVFILERPDIYEVGALGFKTHPTDWHREKLNL